MFKVAKLEELEKQTIEIFETKICETDKNLKQNYYKSLGFKVSGQNEISSYSLMFYLRHRVERLLELKEGDRINFFDQIDEGDIILSINGEKSFIDPINYPDEIKFYIVRGYENKFIITVNLISTCNDIAGICEIEFNLNNYLDK